MLTEDVVINSVCVHLAADGWQILSRAMPDQRGTDVVATRAGIRLEVVPLPSERWTTWIGAAGRVMPGLRAVMAGSCQLVICPRNW